MSSEKPHNWLVPWKAICWAQVEARPWLLGRSPPPGLAGALRKSTVMGPGNVSAGGLPRSVTLVSFHGQLSTRL